MKVLHVFDHSLPQHSGYAFRSECILHAQRDLGIETLQMTGPKHVHEGLSSEPVGELEFLRTPEVVSGNRPLDQLRCVTALRKYLRTVLRRERPDVLHCHSPCLNGLAAIGLGVPLVYEIRACWEDAAVSSGTTTEGSLRYRLSRALETFVARRADAVVVICNGLRDEFLERGIPTARVVRVGNAVDPDSLPRVDPAAVDAYRKSIGMDGRQVLGFFGSYYDYEGLELLIDALPAVLERAPNCAVILAGTGEAEPAIRAAISRHGLDDRVRLLGRVPHEEIAKCYGVADVMVFPRLPRTLTHMVTPLKPLEAMYLNTTVVASDVGGHRELVRDRETGMLFEAGNRQALTDALVEVLNDQALAASLKQNGRKYVMQGRLWNHMAQRYQDLYQRLVQDRRLAAPATDRLS